MCPTPNQDLESSSQGISLEELAAAFAQAMGIAPAVPGEPQSPEGAPPSAAAAQPPTQQPIEQPDEPLGSPQAPPAAESEDDACCPISPRSIIEAMLFVGNRDNQPLSAARAAELMRGVEPEEIPGLVDELNERYTANGCPYHVVHEGAGYRLTLRRAFYPLRNKFAGRVREARLSQAALDVLAIVAYQQPLTADEISRVRDKPSSHVLAQLVRRGLLRAERDQTKRRTTRYFVTGRFLKLFNLDSLDDLPRSEDLDRQ